MPLLLIRSPMNMFYTEIMGDIDAEILRAIRHKEGWNQQDWSFVESLKRSERHITTINLLIPDVLTIICSEFEYEVAKSTVYLSHPEGEHFLLYILQKKIFGPQAQLLDIDDDDDAMTMDIAIDTMSLYDETYKNKGTMTEYDKRFYIDLDRFREIPETGSELPGLAGMMEKDHDKKGKSHDKAKISDTAKPTEEASDAQDDTEGDDATVIDPATGCVAKPIDQKSKKGKISKKSSKKSKLEAEQVEQDETKLSKKDKKKLAESDSAVAQKKSKSEIETSMPSAVIYKDASTQKGHLEKRPVKIAESSTTTPKSKKAEATTSTDYLYLKPVVYCESPEIKFGYTHKSDHTEGISTTEESHHDSAKVEVSTSNETDVDTVKERSSTQILIIKETTATQIEDDSGKSESIPEIIEAPSSSARVDFGPIKQTRSSRLLIAEPSTSTQQKDAVETDLKEKSIAEVEEPEVEDPEVEEPVVETQSTHSEFPDVSQITQTIMLSELPLQSTEGETDSFDTSNYLRRRRLFRRRRKYDVKEVIDRLGSSHAGNIVFKRKHSTSASSEDTNQEDPEVAYVIAEPLSKSIFDYVIDIPRKLSEKLLSFIHGSPSQTEQQSVSSSARPEEFEPVPSTSKVDDSEPTDFEPSTSTYSSKYTFLQPPTELPFKLSKGPMRKAYSTPSSHDLCKTQRSKEIFLQTSKKCGVIELKRYDPSATTSVHVEKETTSMESKSRKSLQIERELSVMAIHDSESSEYNKPSTSSSDEN